jgi:alpha-beta hydrolase superfamily lysophospholipase
MVQQVQSLGTEPGSRLAYRAWRPQGTARAAVAIIPGFNAHSGYYEWTGERLAAAGYAAYAVDLRGRGASDGERFYVRDFAEYVEDAARLVACAKASEPGVPLFLLGHSAGGVVACLYALEHQAELAGLISESFAHELPAPDFALAAIRGLSHLAPHAHVLRLKNEDFSRDPAAVAAMNADPLIAHETQPTATLAALVRADEVLKRGFATLTLPLLILHGTVDKAAKPSGSQHLFDAAGSTDKSLKLYEGGYHDPLADIDRERVIADILAWLDARAESAPTVQAGPTALAT